ncbi:MAG: deoxyguanosinetriphosphate triphosphohydrolase [Bacteroidota bacterium]
MHWNSLFSNKRLGASNTHIEAHTSRNEYLKDYDRMIFSSPFRRMQNKTQVFPLPGHVFVHNRLTHSLEVASVGRSLGQLVGEEIVKKYPNQSADFREFYKYQLSTVVATACLAHDVGNPPFGHSGEEAIRTFFENLSGSAKEAFSTKLSDNQQKDFLFFEGNANTFRLLTHETLGIHRMAYTTLASIVKYPCPSASGFNKSQISTKKSGFFEADIEKYKTVVNELGIEPIDAPNHIYPRHPFVYLMEAADDICYRIIDLEDAARLKILSFDQVFELLKGVLDTESLPRIEASLAKQTLDNQRLSFLRATVINQLVQQCTLVFMQNEAELMMGTLNQSLIDLLPESQLAGIKKIDKISVQKIYNDKAVIEIELAGYNVIGGLLEEFMEAIIQPDRKKSQKLLALIPTQFDMNQEKLYDKILALVDFISGMTDLYAIDLYRKLKGISV